MSDAGAPSRRFHVSARPRGARLTVDDEHRGAEEREPRSSAPGRLGNVDEDRPALGQAVGAPQSLGGKGAGEHRAFHVPRGRFPPARWLG